MEQISAVAWKDEYNIGIAQIDGQHKYLVDIINALYDIIVNSPETYSSKAPAVLEEIIGYTKYHFNYEEREYFRKYNYPSADFHALQHTNFTELINSKVKRCTDSPNIEDGKNLYKTLVTWLLNHIAVADRAWAKFVIPKMK